MSDGSSAYLGTINQALISTYYYLLENLVNAGFDYQEDSNGDPTNVKISWIKNEQTVVLPKNLTTVDKEVPLPIVAIDDVSGNKTAFELGNPASGRSRNYLISVHANNVIERNKYVNLLENIFSEREITIRDYNDGSPATVADNSNMPVFGQATTGTAFTSSHSDPTNPNILDRYIGGVSFTLEILQSID